MRRLVILMVVFGLVELMRPLGSAGYGAQALLAFGFLVLAAYTVGEIAKSLHAPKIVGYLAAGMLFGPSALGTVSAEALVRLSPVSDLAIALIAFLAGAELRWDEVKTRGTALLKIASAELALGLAVLGGVVFGAREIIPVMRELPVAHAAAFALLFASIAIVHSPAVTMGMLTETGARGPVARTTLGVVLVVDVVVVLLFSGAVAVARQLVPQAGAETATVGMLVWEIGGALLVGALLGGAIALYLRFVGEELFLFALLIALLGAEVAHATHVETLLMLLTAGFVAENFSPPARGEALRHAMERSAAPVFVVFFALSGGKIDVAGFVALMPVVIPLFLLRMGTIWTGTWIGARWARLPPEEGGRIWMGLISQVGVAIGLATVVSEAFPVFGAELRTLLLALIAVNQTAGPILFRRALVASGEVTVVPATGEVVAAEATSAR